MKNIIQLFFLLISIFVISSCSSDIGCEINFPCSPINFGTFKTNDSTEYWIPQNLDSITITNNNGFSSTVNYVILNENYKAELNNRTEPVSNSCRQTLSCSDYYYLNFKGWKYVINDLNIEIKVYRSPKMSSIKSINSKPTASEIYSKGDYMLASLYNGIFTTDFNDATFLNSIILNNVEYKNVFQKSFEGTYPIYIRKVYFNKGLGLIGYELSNNEVWNLNIK
jgi:hypothetical protein